MEEALRDLLAGDTAVAALVDTRIAWGGRAQGGQLPAIVLTLVTGRRGYVHAGQDGLVDNLVQLDCWAQTYAAAKGLARACTALLSGYREPSGDVQAVFIEAERDLPDESVQPGQSQIFHRTSLDLRIWRTAA